MDSIEVQFPLGGTWLVGEFGEQPALTTVSGVNVRGQDPFEQRLRGGSRRGTSKLMPVRASGVNPIQCLDFVVTTDGSASLFAADQSSDAPGIRITDPSSSNFPNGPGPTGPGGNAQGGPFGPPDFNRRQPVVPHTVRQGGNGVMRRRTASPVVPPVVPPPPSVTPAFVQKATDTTGSSVTTMAVTPAADVAFDSTVIVAIAWEAGAAAPNPTASVTDNQAHTYTQVGSTVTVVDFFGGHLNLAVFALFWQATTQAATVTVTLTSGASLTVAVLNYVGETQGTPASSPEIDATSSASSGTPAASPATMTAGTPAVTQADDLMLGFFTTALETDAFAAAAGYTERVNLGTGAAGPNLFVQDKFGVDVPEEVTATVDGYNAYAALAAAIAT